MAGNRKFHKQVSSYLCQGDFFVNLGANDGVTNDPVFGLIEKFSLRGIAVEPVGIAYETLCRNYAELPAVICERAVVYSGERKPIYRLCDEFLYADPVLTQVSSMDRGQLVDFIERFRRGELDPSVYEKIRADTLDAMSSPDSILVPDSDMPYLTFDELMVKHAVERVDFLNIDIEGYDYDVLMSIDLARWKPKVIVVETRLFTVEQQEQFAGKMRENGYLFLQKFDYYSEVYARHW